MPDETVMHTTVGSADCAHERYAFKAATSAEKLANGASDSSLQIVCEDCGQVATILAAKGPCTLLQIPWKWPRRGEEKKPDPSLARSKLERNGLKAGTPAPEFSLPSLDGGVVGLADIKGKRTLLVFSDPNCGPCAGASKHVQKLYESGTNVLMIDRKSVV